jgi:hypothetical protein
MDYVLVRIQSSIYLTARNRMETLKKTIVRYGKEKTGRTVHQSGDAGG